MRWLVRFLNRIWFCPVYGHIWAGDWIEYWIKDLHCHEFHCLACGCKQLHIDIETTGISPYTLDN